MLLSLSLLRHLFERINVPLLRLILQLRFRRDHVKGLPLDPMLWQVLKVRLTLFAILTHIDDRWLRCRTNWGIASLGRASFPWLLTLELAHLAVELIPDIVLLEEAAYWRKVLHFGLWLEFSLHQLWNLIYLKVLRPPAQGNVTFFIVTIEAHILAELGWHIPHISTCLQEVTISDLIELTSEVIKSPLSHAFWHTSTWREGLYIMVPTNSKYVR